DPVNRTGRVVLFSADPASFQEFQREHQRGVDQIEDEDSKNTTYREIEPGIVEMTTFLADREITSGFVIYGVWTILEPGYQTDEWFITLRKPSGCQLACTLISRETRHLHRR